MLTMAQLSKTSSVNQTVSACPCAVHQQENAVLFCTECESEQTACLLCIASRGRHANHRIVSLEDGLSRTTSDFKIMLENIQLSCSKVEEKNRETRRSDKMLLHEVENASRKINHHINRLIDHLEHLRLDLHMSVLQAVHTARQRASAREKLELSCKNFRTAAECMKELRKLLTCGTLSELVKRRSALQEACGRFQAALDCQDGVAVIPRFEYSTDVRFVEEMNTLVERTRRLRESLAPAADTSKGPTPVQSTASAEQTEVLFRIGGFNSTAVKTSELYDTAKDRWLQVAPMSTARTFSAAAYWNGKVVVTGGKDEMYVPLRSSEQYDAEANEWSPFSSLNTARSGHTMVNFNGCLFAIGGCGFRDALNLVERFNADTNQWQEASFLLSPRRNFAAAALEAGIVVAGGRHRSVLSNCEFYTKQSNLWNPIAPLTTARHFASAAAHNCSVFVFGGQDCSNRYLDDAEQYDFTADKWTVLQTRSSVGRCCSAACVNDSIYILGSTALRNGQLLAERFEPGSGSYSKVSTISQACERFATSSACVSTSVLNQRALSNTTSET